MKPKCLNKQQQMSVEEKIAEILKVIFWMNDDIQIQKYFKEFIIVKHTGVEPLITDWDEVVYMREQFTKEEFWDKIVDMLNTTYRLIQINYSILNDKQVWLYVL